MKNNSIILILVFWLFSNGLQAQLKLSKYERRWAMIHPVSAIKVKIGLKRTQLVYQEMKKQATPDGYESGGKLDAFRHIYTMAYLSQRISLKKLRTLGVAHEKGNYLSFLRGQYEFTETPDSLGTVMDLNNNELGFKIGIYCKKMNPEDLKNEVLKAIYAGEAWYLKRNSNGVYVMCDGKEINRKEFEKKWFVPKCLIKTNE